MNPRTKSLVIKGALFTVGAVALLLAYKYAHKKLREARLRKERLEKEQKDKEQGITDPKIIKPEEQTQLIGKTVYPKADYVNVRSSADVNNGIINNFIGKVIKPNPVGKVLDWSISGDGYTWYRVAVVKANLRDDKDLGSAEKDATTGYVREDGVTIK